MILLSARLSLHTAPGGVLSSSASLSRWDTLTKFIESAIVGESARWGDSLWNLGEQYAVRRTRDTDWRNNNADIRSIIQENTQQLIDAMNAAGFSNEQSAVSIPVSRPVSVPTPVALPVRRPIAQPVASPRTPPVSPPVLSSGMTLTLFNAATGLPIGPLANGSIINLAAVGTSLTIIATPTLANVVIYGVFNYDGGKPIYENHAPFALAGDEDGVFIPWTPTVGAHNLQVRAFSSKNGAGTLLSSLTISFSVVSSGSPPVPVPVAAPHLAPPVSPPVATPVSPPVATPVSPQVSPVSPPMSSLGMTLALFNAATDQLIGPITDGSTLILQLWERR